MSESAFQKVTRQGIERNAHDAYVAGDSTEADRQLELLPYGKQRSLMGAVAMWQYLKDKGSKAARFFESEALEALSQPTEEIPIVTPEMLAESV